MKKTAIALAVAALFGGYALLNWTAPPLANSPDEMANRFFAETYAVESRLYAFTSLNYFADGRIHPRSIRVVDDVLVPVGFVGLPLIYGLLAKVAGLAALPYFTAFAAVMAVLVWGQLVGHWFGARVGRFAAIILAVCPVWWYWASRAFMPNIFFLASAIIAAWFFFTTPVRRVSARLGWNRLDQIGFADAAFGGTFLALALGVRMAEAYWIGGVILLLAAWRWRSTPWIRLAVFLATAAVAVLPFLATNQSLYGSWFATGYAAADGSVPLMGLPEGGGARLLGPLRPFLFPLGFAPRTALSRFLTVAILPFWWWWLAIIVSYGVAKMRSDEAVRPRSGLLHSFTSSLLHFFSRLTKRPAGAAGPRNVDRTYAVAAAAISLWLIFFYGSWNVQDNPAPGLITIGSSYYRYWLPIFVLATVPLAGALARWWDSRSRWLRPAGAGLMVLLAIAGPWQAWAAPQEGLAALRQNLKRSAGVMERLLILVPSGSIVVADRADKWIFPQRLVITPLRDEGTFAALANLKRKRPLFYYGITLPSADLDFLRRVRLAPLGLGAEPLETFGEETLYALPLSGSSGNEIEKK